MSKGNDAGLLELLKKEGRGGDPWAALAAKAPAHDPSGQGDDDAPADSRLNEMLKRISDLATGEGKPGAPPLADVAAAHSSVVSTLIDGSEEFVPIEPTNLREAGLTDSEVESLVLKYLLARGDASGREVAEQIRLPFVLLEPLLRQLKFDQLLVYRGAAPMNDYLYQLTDLGRERARRFMDHCTYFGSAPVALTDYIVSVKRQSLENQHPTEADLRRAFDDILINDRMLRRLGPAINSGRGLFLFGRAGNGKTTIAERVTKAFGQFIWIPRSIGVDGEILRLFDPVNHEECPLPPNTGLLDQSKVDRRWVRIRRPTIVVGGELTMDNLEVTLNRSTGISECPLQLKSNCGTLVVDDFGRQKMPIDTLLNRWIVPLEKRFDYLNLSNGKKIQVPFDQLIIFSTNLEPRDLVDEAFLRRIPYKIEVIDPTEQEYKDLLKMMCGRLGFTYDEGPIEYLIETHYKKTGRPFRCCQPRDLLQQVRNYCLFRKIEPKLTEDFLDLACENYFAVM